MYEKFNRMYFLVQRFLSQYPQTGLGIICLALASNRAVSAVDEVEVTTIAISEIEEGSRS